MSVHVTLIPGDGIGPAITEATVRILEAAGAQVTWDERLAGVAALTTHHTPIPEETLESIRARAWR
jgi:isocitrate dehydrogenase (NAD+)